MMQQKIDTRGISEQSEIPIEKVVQDSQSSSQKFRTSIQTPENAYALLITLATIVLIFPQIGDISLLGCLVFTCWALTRTKMLPIKLPTQSQNKQNFSLLRKTKKSESADGIFFVGNEISTNNEIWLSNSDCRQHLLVLGTTGAGKTETLLSFAANALSWGSGFMFCDGKGDVSLFAKVYAMARRVGREDDLIVLNYMTGNSDTSGMNGKLRSNTLNPFSTGSSDSLSQLIISLMEDTGTEGAMWKGRAAAMFTGVMGALVWLRDQGRIELNVSTIRDHLSLRAIMDLANPDKHSDMPNQIQKSINAYLNSLPSFDIQKNYDQSQTTVDQHGYLEMQFTKTLGSLADVYGHIFQTPYGEVDMTDVVLNRRILVILLPALEKSRDEVSNLGKVIVATLKNMMAATLGSEIEGNWSNVVENRAINSKSPFICILDEVGYYTVSGMDLMSAQARSLGFTMIYAGQDINAMKSLNEKVFGSIQGNTNTKIIMRTEDPDTGLLAISAAGSGYRAETHDYKQVTKEFSKEFKVKEPYRLEKTDRVNFLDLKSQDAGEMHIIYKDKLVRAKSFFAEPEQSLVRTNLKLRTNHFITVKRITQKYEPNALTSKIVEQLMEPISANQVPSNFWQPKKNKQSKTLEVITSTFDHVKNFPKDNQQLSGPLAFGSLQRTIEVTRTKKSKSKSPRKRKKPLKLNSDDRVYTHSEIKQRNEQLKKLKKNSPYLTANSTKTNDKSSLSHQE